MGHPPVVCAASVSVVLAARVLGCLNPGVRHKNHEVYEQARCFEGRGPSLPATLPDDSLMIKRGLFVFFI